MMHCGYGDNRLEDKNFKGGMKEWLRKLPR